MISNSSLGWRSPIKPGDVLGPRKFTHERQYCYFLGYVFDTSSLYLVVSRPHADQIVLLSSLNKLIVVDFQTEADERELLMTLGRWRK